MALPPSSPRLPSPPPPAEIQIGPKSPAAPGASLAQQQMEQQMEQTILDANAKRRIHPGTRAADFAVGPPLVPLNELDSAFQLQEHLAALHYFHTASNTLPISRDTARTLALAPAGTDRTLWLYELCRFLIAQCNGLIVGFLFDTPPCSAATCPEMRASEWQFLCAVHEQPRSCCAIDYCCHTLDWAANVVTNPKIFPSRFVFADPHDKNAAVKNLINVFRRLHRIFAHAWFQHRGVFWSVEGQTGLYVFFKTVCDMYDLLPAENYKLPPEAEGLDTASTLPSSGAAAGGAGAEAAAGGGTLAPPESTPGLIPIASIADRKTLGYSPGPAGNPPPSGPSHRGSGGGGGSGGGSGLASELLGGDNEHLHSIGRTNTRRHIRSSPSTGSAVTTVLEQDEDGAGAAALSSLAAGRPISILQSSHLTPESAQTPATHSTTPPSATEQEVADDHGAEVNGTGLEISDVPVIVQHDQQDWTPIAPVEQDAAAAAAAAAAAEPEAAEPETVRQQTAQTAETDTAEAVPTAATAAADPAVENEKSDASAEPVAAGADETKETIDAEPAAAREGLDEASAGAVVAESAEDAESASVVDDFAKDEAKDEAAAPATKEGTDETAATTAAPAAEQPAEDEKTDSGGASEETSQATADADKETAVEAETAAEVTAEA